MNGLADGYDDVVAGMAGEQLGFEHLVAVIDVVGDRDAGLLGEIRDRVGGDVVGPVIDVQPLFLGGGAQRPQRGDNTRPANLGGRFVAA